MCIRDSNGNLSSWSVQYHVCKSCELHLSFLAEPELTSLITHLLALRVKRGALKVSKSEVCSLQVKKKKKKESGAKIRVWEPALLPKIGRGAALSALLGACSSGLL